jgi:hypothetical protein
VLRNNLIEVGVTAMANIRRAKSAVLTAAAGATLGVPLAFVCIAIALWAMWTMLAAAVDSDWLQVAGTFTLWLAATGMAHLLVPPRGG